MAGRLEDEGLLRGTTSFVRDLPHDDCAHVVFVRSQVAAGAVRSIDASAARAAPGVAAVLTGDDLGLAPFSYFAALSVAPEAPESNRYRRDPRRSPLPVLRPLSRISAHSRGEVAEWLNALDC